MNLTINSTLELNDGHQIPRIGLGVYRSPAGETTISAIHAAFAEGYRHVDTAMIYANEESVGEAIASSNIDREDIYLTSKLWNRDHGYDKTLKACEASLGRLKMDYLDLYLIHWPVENLRLDTWRAMEQLKKDGKCRSIGVSNYMVRHLQELMDNSEILPAVNQIELSPYNFKYLEDVVDFCKEHGIAVEAYSPLTKAQKLNDPPLVEIAARYQKTPAQVLIRWSLQHDFIVLPKSIRPQRIAENCAIYDFDISDADMAILDGLNEDLITGWDPTSAP